MRPKALLGITGVAAPINTAELFGNTSLSEPALCQLMVGATYKEGFAVVQAFPSQDDILLLMSV